MPADIPGLEVADEIDAAQRFIRHVVPLLAAGRVRPVVDRVMPLTEAAAAHDYLAKDQVYGKVVVAV